MLLAGSGTSLGSPFVASNHDLGVKQPSGFISIIEQMKAPDNSSKESLQLQLDKSQSKILLSHKASEPPKERPF